MELNFLRTLSLEEEKAYFCRNIDYRRLQMNVRTRSRSMSKDIHVKKTKIEFSADFASLSMSY